MILASSQPACGPWPLRVRSGYSLLCGPAALDRVVAKAAELGHRYLALTDVNNVCGATFFWKQACERGLAPIIGAELMQGGQAVVALVAEDKGYENLCRVITRIQRRAAEGSLPSCGAGVPPAHPWQCQDQQARRPRHAEMTADLAELSGGLHLIVEQEAARALLDAGADRRRLWMGLDVTAQGHAQIRQIVESAQKLGLPCMATGTAQMTSAEDFEVAQLLAAIRRGVTFDNVPAVELPNRHAILRSPQTLRQQLVDYGGIDESLAKEALFNNQRLAEECAAFKLLPRQPVFPDFPCAGGIPPGQFLRRLCREGLTRRYGDSLPQGVEERLEKELRLIQAKGFCEYFLVVWDIVQYARRQGAPVAGRGSGASSLVAYLLGITNVCPLAYNIPFERFLSEQRTDFPDLDIDFCWRIRDDVIAYAFSRWGADHVAMVSMHATFQQRSAVRETAKALGFSDDQITHMEDGRLLASIAGQRLVSLSRRILGLPHNLSVHPGGIVIGRKPIDHYVPVQPSAKGVCICQFDKDGVEDINLVKLDLLGNRSLSTIRYATDLILRHRGVAVDIETLGEDESTIRTLCQGRTIGCNQLESPAMRHLLEMMQPRSTHDVMKVLALIRPGAASIGMKETFVRRHRGLEAVPLGYGPVDEILRQTHGVMLYEDDVMSVAAAVLHCSLGEADRVRKAIQKCRDDRQREELSRRFLTGCRASNVDEEYARNLWVQMAKFNSYSFCRAHAASYARLAYAGAYLKTHYPLEFWVSALNNNQSMYPLRLYVEQAKREGVRFLPPDANRSQEEFSLADEAIEGNPSPRGSIRVGFNRIAGLGPAHVQALLQARQEGAFEGLSDFLARTGMGHEEVRSMILCGAFDWTMRRRPALMLEMELFMSAKMGRIWRGRPLLSLGPIMPAVPGDYDPLQKYMQERQILGLSIREHIMKIYRPLLEHSVTIDSRHIAESVGRRVRLAGVLEAQRTTHTQGGQTMMFLTLDDEYGVFEVTLFPDACREHPSGFSHYGPYIIEGKVEEQYGAITITADHVDDKCPALQVTP